MTVGADQGPRPSGNALEEALLEHVGRHIESEREILAAYGRLAEEADDDYVRYLARIILDDEERHHRVLTEMRNRVESDVIWRELTPQVPRLSMPADRQRLVEETERFIAAEARDAEELRRLRRLLKPIRETSLLSLMVEVIQLDTEKHLRILEFIRRTATNSV